MIVNVPSRIHVAHLREEFMEFLRLAQPGCNTRTGNILTHDYPENWQQDKGFLAALER